MPPDADARLPVQPGISPGGRALHQEQPELVRHDAGVLPHQLHLDGDRLAVQLLRVGRLAGLGYCQNLIMRSKYQDDPEVSCMHWDCKKLKELLRDTAALSVQQILEEIVETSVLSAKGLPDHFFEIEMQHVIRNKKDSLMNDDLLRLDGGSRKERVN